MKTLLVVWATLIGLFFFWVLYGMYLSKRQKARSSLEKDMKRHQEHLRQLGMDERLNRNQLEDEQSQEELKNQADMLSYNYHEFLHNIHRPTRSNGEDNT